MRKCNNGITGTKGRNRNHFCVMLAVMLLLAQVLPCYGSTTQEKIGERQEEKAQTETELKTTEERIAALEAKKGESEAYLTELNCQLTELTNGLEELQKEYDSKQEELTQLQTSLEEAKAQEEEQYEDMKLRIQYMYEHSTSNGALEALFSAESFSEFLNRADTMSSITKYDREMLATYQETRESVTAKEAQIQEEQEAIRQLQEQRTAQQDQVQTLYEATYQELQTCAADLAGAQSQQASLVSQIQAQEDSLNQLLAQAKQEEVAAQETAAAQAAQAAQEAEAARLAATASAAGSTASAGSGQASTASTAGSSNGGSSSESATDATSSAAAGQSAGAGSEGGSSNGTYLGNFRLTAYCACAKCCGKWASSAATTASGATAVQGVTVAMGGVPFGTKLSINGHVYTVQDRGTAYGHVDIYFASHAEALQFGMQYADVYQIN
jgi:peptidoglycan DL-endopeptidase CwlO